jgi:hypothetical protein
MSAFVKCPNCSLNIVAHHLERHYATCVMQAWAWACPACTFGNHGGDECQVCRTRRAAPEPDFAPRIMRTASLCNEEFGLGQEKRLVPAIRNFFKCDELYKTAYKFARIDFVSGSPFEECGEVNVELRSRRCEYGRYPTVVIDLSKIKYCVDLLNSGRTVHIVWNYADAVVYHTMTATYDYTKTDTGPNSEWFYFPKADLRTMTGVSGWQKASPGAAHQTTITSWLLPN